MKKKKLFLDSEVGRLFRDLRAEGHLTQAQMAELLNVGQGYISRVESGLASPSFGMLQRVKKACNKSWDELEVYLNETHEHNSI